jgi:Icc-related predicted phosphoesterase
MKVPKRRKEATDLEGLSLYYASDIHGSELCWRKFLGAAKAYGVDALIMGGDLAGKAIVPVLSDGDEFTAEFLGERRRGRGEQELEQLLAAIRFNGMYPWLASAPELEQAREDPAAREEIFVRVLGSELRRWVDIADQRLGSDGRMPETFVMGGNDDPLFVDDILATSTTMVSCDARIVRVKDHEMLSFSYTNRTPWDSPRELDEEDLYRRLKNLADQLEAPEGSIFNLHVPPYDTGLDTATKLNPDFTPVLEGGHPVNIPVGSTAVRHIIEEYRPALALHGHIHESAAATKLGPSLLVNPGSEYNSGQIHGAVVRFTNGQVHSHQLVVG